MCIRTMMMLPCSFRHLGRILCFNLFVSFICSVEAVPQPMPTARSDLMMLRRLRVSSRWSPSNHPRPSPIFSSKSVTTIIGIFVLILRKACGRDSGNFQVQFIHPGLFYTHSVTMNTFDSQGIRKVAFSPKQFTYGRNKFADKILPNSDSPGFASLIRFIKGTNTITS